MLPIGIVTNVLRNPLDAGLPLLVLLEGAYRRGFCVFELRQRAMGECEDSHCVPRPDQCAALRGQFPEAEFNIAIEFPIFGRPYGIDDPLYVAARDAAYELRAETGHLRFVDLTPDFSLLTDPQRMDEQARCLELLVADAASMDVRISIEHSRQPLAAVRGIIGRASALLESNGIIAKGSLGICYDPCNLVNSALLTEDPVHETARLAADEIFMFHIKQSRNGIFLPYVDDGDVDWPTVLRMMQDKGYSGPACLEIASSSNIWDNLERSREHVNRLMQG